MKDLGVILYFLSSCTTVGDMGFDIAVVVCKDLVYKDLDLILAITDKYKRKYSRIVGQL